MTVTAVQLKKIEMDSSISVQCRHSINTWDRYHIACTVNDRENSFSEPTINNRYLTVELNRESWMNTRCLIMMLR